MEYIKGNLWRNYDMVKMGEIRAEENRIEGVDQKISGWWLLEEIRKHAD